MFEEIIYHEINGVKAKFTIRERIIDGETYYYSHVINTEINSYKNLSEPEKKIHIGIEISDGKGNSINYRNLDDLKQDILTKYGLEWLQTEK